MKKTHLFVPLIKVDEAKRTVTGQITAEILDKSGETFHYETSAPYFKAWSANIDKVTKGKSKGNVRAMHQPIAAGKLTDIQFDDAGKTITATAKIIDDAEWAKVQEGVYTGFSIGGKYVKQWEEGEGDDKVKYFTADPVEVSIVDNPCVPTAHFTAVKADGAEVQVMFKLYEPTNDEIAAKAAELAGDGKWTDFVNQARELLKAERGMEDAEKLEDEEEEADETEETSEDEEDEEDEDAAGKMTALQLVKQQWIATDGKGFDKKADCVAYQETLDDPIKAAMAKANAVIAGTPEVVRFPVDTELHIRASWVLANKATFESDEERTKTLDAIKAAWVEKFGKEPPTIEVLEQFIDQDVGKAITEVRGEVELKKGMWVVSEWARAISGILCASDYLGWCNEDSQLPAQAKTMCAALLTFLIDVVTEEVARELKALDKVNKEAEAPLAKFILAAVDAVEIEKIETPANEELQKALDIEKAERAKLEKMVGEAVSGITTLTAELEKLKSTPEPRRHPNGKVVEKSGDRDGATPTSAADEEAAFKKLIEGKTPEQISLMVIRASQANPQKML